MSSPAAPLPEFELPPVIEVVCGVQFDPLKTFQSVHFGAFWQRIKDEYPKIEERPPIGDVRETEQGTELRADLTEMVTSELPPLRRCFYVDESGGYILQLQSSRFLANWRKTGPEDAYPRYATALKRFLRGWQTFLQFMGESGIASPKVNQYELTYINHIPETKDERFPVGIEHYLPMWSWRQGQSLNFLSSPTNLNLGLAFALPDHKGRLHVTLNQGRRKDGTSVAVLELTARGPGAADGADMESWLSLAHEWIVRGFTDLTSSQAHREWRRTR